MHNEKSLGKGTFYNSLHPLLCNYLFQIDESNIFSCF